MYKSTSHFMSQKGRPGFAPKREESSGRLTLIRQTNFVPPPLIPKGLEKGSVLFGEVVRLEKYGAIIDIGGREGLLPISQISNRRIKHANEVLYLEQKLCVTVEKVSLRFKRKVLCFSLSLQEKFP